MIEVYKKYTVSTAWVSDSYYDKKFTVCKKIIFFIKMSASSMSKIRSIKPTI